jgi:hypothetical protein
MLRYFIFFISLFLNSSFIHCMEISEKDFRFKPTIHELVNGNFLPKENELNNIYDFATENDSNCSFKDYILLAKHLNHNDILPTDITNYILRIGYQEIINCKVNQEKFKNSQGFSLEYNSFKSIFWANKKQQKTLYYFLYYTPKINNRFIIDSINLSFTQKIDNTLQALPAVIKNNIEDRGNPITHYYVKTHDPSPSLYNTWLQYDNNTQAKHISRLITTVGLMSGGALITTGLSFPSTNNPLQELITQVLPTFGGIGVMYGAGMKFMKDDVPLEVFAYLLAPTVSLSMFACLAKKQLWNVFTIKNTFFLLSSGLAACLGTRAVEYQGEYIKRSLTPSRKQRIIAHGFEKRTLSTQSS